MYIPKHFKEGRVAVLQDFIRTHPFGILVMHATDGLEANHIPFELRADFGELGFLRGHVARANPLWRKALQESEVLVVFQGPHGYVSPSWYPSKQQNDKVVPTWNYAAVHAYGRLRAVQDKQWLLSLVERLTEHHERGRETPWHPNDAPRTFIDKMLAAIVGIEIQIVHLEGKWKLSQNRSAGDAAGVVDGLCHEMDSMSEELAKLIQEHQIER